MKLISIKIAILFCLVIIGMGRISAQPSDWMQDKLDKLDQASKEVDFLKKMSLLIEVYDYSVLNRMYNPEREEIYQMTLKAILNTPNYGGYFKAKVENARDQSKKPNFDLSLYVIDADVIGVLGGLKGPESVRVLSYFLLDDEGLDGTLFGMKLTGEEMYTPISHNALQNIRSLNIENPPYDSEARLTRDNVDDMLESWRQWWREVEAGKRTYRFVGSPIEYGPDGPVSAGELKRVERNARRDAELNKGRAGSSEADQGDGKSKLAQNETSNLPALLSAMGLFIAASAWYIFRRMKTGENR